MPTLAMAIDLDLSCSQREGVSEPTDPPYEQITFHCRFSGGVIDEKYSDHSQWTYAFNNEPQEISEFVRDYHATIKPGQRIEAYIGNIVETIGHNERGYECRIYIAAREPYSFNRHDTGVYRYIKQDSTQTGSAQLSYTVEKGLKKLYLSIYLYKKDQYKWGEDFLNSRCDITVEYTVEQGDDEEETSIKGNEDENENEDDDDDEDDEEEDEEEAEIDDDAWNWDGAWDYVIPAGVAIALIGGGAVAIKKNKKKDKNKKDKDKKGGKDKNKKDKTVPPLDRLELRIYKDFDNTIYTGFGDYPVYAQIIRISASGEETVDPVLTSQIMITGDNYLKTTKHRLADGWKCADVVAPEGDDNPPEEGVVTFSLKAGTGSYTNHLHFRLEAGKMLFGQDNLTLPAHYDKEERLPFVVQGVPDATPVEAVLVDGNDRPSDFYEVEAVWNEEKQEHQVIIKDLKQDANIDNGTPGEFIILYIWLKTKTPGGRLIEAKFPLVRYYMGLTFKLDNEANHVRCYTEEYNPNKHKKRLVGNIRDGKSFVPAETKGQLLYYDYDEETHQVEIFTVVPESYSVKAVDQAEDKQVQGIGLLPDFKDEQGNVATEFVLRCMLGVIDAPSRIDAVITFSATINERQYTCEKQVLLCSQRWRTFQSDAEWSEAMKADKEILKKLENLRSRIEMRKQADTLLPVINYIDNLTLGYEVRYGFDEASLHFVGALYNYMMNERAEYTYKQTVPLSLADDILECVRLTFEQYARPVVNAVNKFNEKYGTIVLVGRVAVGFWTYGSSEGFFRAYDALSLFAMGTTLTDIYIEEGGEGLSKNLWMMAKDMGKMQIIMAGVQVGLNKSLGGLRAKYNPRVSVSKPITAADVKPKTPAKPTKAQYSSAKKGRITKEALKESNELQAKAAREVASPEAEVKTKGVKTKRDLTEATKYAEAKANRRIEDLHAVIEMCNENPTPENLALKRRLVIELQGDKIAMHKLKNLEGADYTMVRSEFNREWYGINAKVDKAVINELAKQHNLRPDQIKIENISSSKMTELLLGKSSTMDRDVTYYYLNAKGEKVYFKQQATEQLYKQALYKEALGYEAHSQEAANMFGKKVDHTVIEDVAHHKESFGTDVGKVMDKTRHAESLENPNQVADAIIWKSEERFVSAEEWFRKADAATDHIEKLELQTRGIYDLLEGGYMTAKDGKKIVIPMDIARKDVNGGLFVSPQLRKAIEYCDLVDTKNPINVTKLEQGIKSAGYNSFEELAKDLGETMRRIGSPKLEAPKA